MNYVEYKVVDVVGGWARGRSWVNGGVALDLGKCMKDERGSTSEGVLEEVLYWEKHIKGKALQKESNNELCQIEGC